MSQIEEAPIVHGSISASTFSAASVELGTTSFDKLDALIDSTSSNPVSNGVTKAALEMTEPPIVSAYSVKLVKTNPVTSDQIYFDYASHLVNTFDTSGIDYFSPLISGATVPASGMYSITSHSKSVTQSNSLNMILKVNGAETKNSTRDGVLVMSTVTFLNSGDSVSLHSGNSTQSKTTLEVTLVKPA